MATRIVDVTLRLIDNMTKPLKDAMDQVDRSQRQIANGAKALKTIGNSISSVGSTLTTSITLPVIAAGTVAVNKFAEVDKTMTLVNSTMGNTEEQAKLINNAMKEAASNSTFGMNDAAQAALNFARAGLSAEQAAASLAPAMNLAAGEGGELDIVSNGLVATINGFGDSFDNAEKYADVFAAACNNSALEVNSFVSSMSVAAPIFSAAGYAVEDASLYMGVMANSGIEASVAANSLKTGFARLVSPAKEGAVMMEKLGISVTNADGTMKDSVTLQKELHDSFATLSESEQIAAASAIFGKNQMSQWLALINTAPGDVAKLNEALMKSGGTSSQMAKDMMSGFGGSIEQLKSSIDVFMTTLGEKLAPHIQKIINLVQTITNKLNGLSDEQFEMIIKIAGIAAVVGPILLIIGKTITGIGNLILAIQNIKKAFSTLSAVGGIVSKFGALCSLKFLAIIAVIALIAGAVYLIVKNWDKIKEFFVNLWENVKIVFGQFVEWLKGFIAKAGEVLSGIKDKFLDIVNFVGQIFMARFQIILSAIKGYIQGWIDGIKNVIDGIKKIFQGIIDFVTGVFTGNWKQAWEGVKSIFGGIFQSLTGLVKAPFNAIIGLVNGAISGINKINITVPDWVPGLGGKNFGFNIPTIPTLYTGTENWKGGTAIINEKAYGGEIVDLPSGSRVYPHDESINKAYNDGINASVGNNSITIAKLADEIIVREDADIERIVNELARKLGDACASTGAAMAMSKMSNKVQSVNKAFAGV